MLLFGVGLFVSLSTWQDSEFTEPDLQAITTFNSNAHLRLDDIAALGTAQSDELSFAPSKTQIHSPEHKKQGLNSTMQGALVALDSQVVVADYLAAWQAQDKDEVELLWLQLSQCEFCIEQLVELIINKNLEKGLMLELAIKMVTLTTDAVLPVFSTLIDPEESRSIAIILSEKLIKDGRSAYVANVFDAIQAAEQKGYEQFARQLTWVVSKLDNPLGVSPVLDVIVGRADASSAYADHVSRLFAKTVPNISDKAFVAEVMSDYYLSANDTEKNKLWDVVSQHPDALVLLAAQASTDGQSYNMEKYATAITQLPAVRAIDGVMELRRSIDQSPGYFIDLIRGVAQNNTNAKTFNRLEIYLQDPNVSAESRLLAAEGLLAIKDNRHARQILDKVLNQSNYNDTELLSYISGRL